MKFDLKRGFAGLVLGTTLSLLANEATAQSGVVPAAPPSLTGTGVSTERLGKNTFIPNSEPASPSDVVIPTTPISAPANATSPAPAPAPASVPAPGLTTINPTTILGHSGMPGGFHPHCFQQPNCRHVIDQLIHHSLGNRLFPNQGPATCGGGVAVLGGCGGGVVFHPGFARPMLPELELTDVNLVSDGSASAGPTYRVAFRNNGPVASYPFKVSLVAVLGTIHDLSPIAAASIPTLAPNAVGNVEIQLPANVMTMGVPTQPLVPFDTLVASVDSFNQVPETNELNNLAVMKRVAIPTAVVTPAVVPSTTHSTPASTIDNMTTPVPPPPPAPATPPTVTITPASPVAPDASNAITPTPPAPPAPPAPPRAPEVPA